MLAARSPLQGSRGVASLLATRSSDQHVARLAVEQLGAGWIEPGGLVRQHECFREFAPGVPDKRIHRQPLGFHQSLHVLPQTGNSWFSAEPARKDGSVLR